MAARHMNQQGIFASEKPSVSYLVVLTIETKHRGFPLLKQAK